MQVSGLSTSRPNILPEILKKSSKYHKTFSKYLEKPSKYLFNQHPLFWKIAALARYIFRVRIRWTGLFLA